MHLRGTRIYFLQSATNESNTKDANDNKQIKIGIAEKSISVDRLKVK
jgi:hypothetical protein